MTSGGNVNEDQSWFQKQLELIDSDEENENENENVGIDSPLESTGEEDFGLDGEKLEMLEKNGFSLQNLSEEMRGDFGVAMEAIKRDESQLRYITPELKDNRPFILYLCSEKILKSLFLLNEVFQSDLEIVLTLVKTNSNNFLAASKELKNLGIFVKLLMEHYGLRLRLVGDELRKNKDFVLWAARLLIERKVFKFGEFSRSVNPELLQDEDFIHGIITCDPSLVTYFDSVKRNEEFIGNVARIDPKILEFVDRDVKESVISELGIEREEPVEEIISEETHQEPGISLTMPSDDEEEEEDPEKMNQFFQDVLEDQKEEEEEEEEDAQDMADFFQNVLDEITD